MTGIGTVGVVGAGERYLDDLLTGFAVKFTAKHGAPTTVWWR